MLTRVEAIVLALLAAAVLAVPVAGTAYITTFVFVLLVAFIVAQSWDWVGGEMGYVNLGQYVFYGVGAYTLGILLVAKLPFAVAIGAAVALAAIVAAVLAFPLFRLQGDYFAFGTLALLPLVEVLAYNFSSVTGGADGVVLPPENVLKPAYALAVAGAVLAFAVTIWLTRSRMGYALKAIRNDEQVAEVMGIRIFPVKVRVLAMSAAMSAFAGGVHTWQLSFIDPPSVFGLGHALVPIAMALLGGSGLLWGPLLGVLLLSALQQWLLIYFNTIQGLIYGLVILVIGRFMPGGILRAKGLRTLPVVGVFGQEHDQRIVRHDRDAPLPTAGEAVLPLDKPKVDAQQAILECRGLTKAFGGNVAVDNVSFAIKPGEIVGLIGANGSGKTTLFNCISKVLEPTGGDILVEGRSTLGRRRDEVAHLGVGRTYQIPRPFGDLTVQENVAIPLMFGELGLEPGAALKEAREFIAYVGLSDRAHERADALSLQQKKALELARGLAARPKILLVDEVASGLTPVEIKRFVEHIRELRDRYGITVIWVEHIFSALAQVVDRVLVLEQGQLIADGPLKDVMKNERVLKTYLGAAAHKAM